MRTCVAAAPVSVAAWLTPPILAETSSVPLAASAVLREISSVAAACSSTAPAMAVAISLTWPTVPPMP